MAQDRSLAEIRKLHKAIEAKNYDKVIDIYFKNRRSDTFQNRVINQVMDFPDDFHLEKIFENAAKLKLSKKTRLKLVELAAIKEKQKRRFQEYLEEKDFLYAKQTLEAALRENDFNKILNVYASFWENKRFQIYVVDKVIVLDPKLHLQYILNNKDKFKLSPILLSRVEPLIESIKAKQQEQMGNLKKAFKSSLEKAESLLADMKYERLPLEGIMTTLERKVSEDDLKQFIAQVKEGLTEANMVLRANMLQKFFAGRLKRIQGTDLIYPYANKDKLSEACIIAAQGACDILDKSYIEVLIPTLDPDAMHAYLKIPQRERLRSPEFKFHQFIVSEDGTRIIEIFDCLSTGAENGKLPHTFIIKGMPNLLSPGDAKNVKQHSVQAQEYWESAEEILRLKKDWCDLIVMTSEPTDVTQFESKNDALVLVQSKPGKKPRALFYVDRTIAHAPVIKKIEFERPHTLAAFTKALYPDVTNHRYKNIQPMDDDELQLAISMTHCKKQTLGKRLQALLLGLEAGNARQRGGDELNARYHANLAIVEFNNYLMSPEMEGEREKIMNLRDASGEYTFRDVWGRLARPKGAKYRSVTYCIAIIGDQLAPIIRNHPELFVTDLELREQKRDAYGVRLKNALEESKYQVTGYGSAGKTKLTENLSQIEAKEKNAFTEKLAYLLSTYYVNYWIDEETLNRAGIKSGWGWAAKQSLLTDSELKQYIVTPRDLGVLLFHMKGPNVDVFLQIYMPHFKTLIKTKKDLQVFLTSLGIATLPDEFKMTADEFADSSHLMKNLLVATKDNPDFLNAFISNDKLTQIVFFELQSALEWQQLLLAVKNQPVIYGWLLTKVPEHYKAIVFPGVIASAEDLLACLKILKRADQRIAMDNYKGNLFIECINGNKIALIKEIMREYPEILVKHHDKLFDYYQINHFFEISNKKNLYEFFEYFLKEKPRELLIAFGYYAASNVKLGELFTLFISDKKYELAEILLRNHSSTVITSRHLQSLLELKDPPINLFGLMCEYRSDFFQEKLPSGHPLLETALNNRHYAIINHLLATQISKMDTSVLVQFKNTLLLADEKSVPDAEKDQWLLALLKQFIARSQFTEVEDVIARYKKIDGLKIPVSCNDLRIAANKSNLKLVDYVLDRKDLVADYDSKSLGTVLAEVLHKKTTPFDYVEKLLKIRPDTSLNEPHHDTKLTPLAILCERQTDEASFKFFQKLCAESKNIGTDVAGASLLARAAGNSDLKVFEYLSKTTELFSQFSNSQKISALIKLIENKQLEIARKYWDLFPELNHYPESVKSAIFDFISSQDRQHLTTIKIQQLLDGQLQTEFSENNSFLTFVITKKNPCSEIMLKDDTYLKSFSIEQLVQCLKTLAGEEFFPEILRLLEIRQDIPTQLLPQTRLPEHLVYAAGVNKAETLKLLFTEKILKACNAQQLSELILYLIDHHFYAEAMFLAKSGYLKDLALFVNQQKNHIIFLLAAEAKEIELLKSIPLTSNNSKITFTWLNANKESVFDVAFKAKNYAAIHHFITQFPDHITDDQINLSAKHILALKTPDDIDPNIKNEIVISIFVCYSSKSQSDLAYQFLQNVFATELAAKNFDLLHYFFVEHVDKIPPDQIDLTVKTLLKLKDPEEIDTKIKNEILSRAFHLYISKQEDGAEAMAKHILQEASSIDKHLVLFKGNTALHYLPKVIFIVRKLMEDNKSLNLENEHKVTFLRLAAIEKRYDILDICIKEKPDYLDQFSDYQLWSVFNRLIYDKKYDLARLLLAAKPDILKVLDTGLLTAEQKFDPLYFLLGKGDHQPPLDLVQALAEKCNYFFAGHADHLTSAVFYHSDEISLALINNPMVLAKYDAQQLGLVFNVMIDKNKIDLAKHLLKLKPDLTWTDYYSGEYQNAMKKLFLKEVPDMKWIESVYETCPVKVLTEAFLAACQKPDKKDSEGNAIIDFFIGKPSLLNKFRWEDMREGMAILIKSGHFEFAENILKKRPLSPRRDSDLLLEALKMPNPSRAMLNYLFANNPKVPETFTYPYENRHTLDDYYPFLASAIIKNCKNIVKWVLDDRTDSFQFAYRMKDFTRSLILLVQDKQYDIALQLFQKHVQLMPAWRVGSSQHYEFFHAAVKSSTILLTLVEQKPADDKSRSDYQALLKSCFTHRITSADVDNSDILLRAAKNINFDFLIAYMQCHPAEIPKTIIKLMNEKIISELLKLPEVVMHLNDVVESAFTPALFNENFIRLLPVDTKRLLHDEKGNSRFLRAIDENNTKAIEFFMKDLDLIKKMSEEDLVKALNKFATKSPPQTQFLIQLLMKIPDVLTSKYIDPDFILRALVLDPAAPKELILACCEKCNKFSGNVVESLLNKRHYEAVDSLVSRFSKSSQDESADFRVSVYTCFKEFLSKDEHLACPLTLRVSFLNKASDFFTPADAPLIQARLNQFLTKNSASLDVRDEKQYATSASAYTDFICLKNLKLAFPADKDFKMTVLSCLTSIVSQSQSQEQILALMQFLKREMTAFPFLTVAKGLFNPMWGNIYISGETVKLIQNAKVKLAGLVGTDKRFAAGVEAFLLEPVGKDNFQNTPEFIAARKIVEVQKAQVRQDR